MAGKITGNHAQFCRHARLRGNACRREIEAAAWSTTPTLRIAHEVSAQMHAKVAASYARMASEMYS